MIEIKIDINSIDYGDVLDKALPEMLPKLVNHKSPLVQKVIDNISGKASIPAKAIINLLPKDLQDEVATAFFNNYREKIVNSITDTLNEQGIKISISDVNVSIK